MLLLGKTNKLTKNNKAVGLVQPFKGNAKMLALSILKKYCIVQVFDKGNVVTMITDEKNIKFNLIGDVNVATNQQIPSVFIAMHCVSSILCIYVKLCA